MRRLGLMIAIALLWLCPTATSAAASLTVTNCASSGGGSLDAALETANATSGGGIITFAIDCPASNRITLFDERVARAITITGNGASRTAILATAQLLVTGAGVLTMTGVTVSGIVNFHDTGSGTIADSVFTSEPSGFNSDVVYANGAASASIVNDTFTNAGITDEATGALRVANSTFSAAYPAGVGNINNGGAGSVTVTDSYFAGTESGIHNQSTGAISVSGSTFENPRYGVSNYIGNATITTSTFYGEDTSIDNAGSGSVEIANSTISGGGFGIYNHGSGTMGVANSIVTVRSPSSPDPCIGTITDRGHNLSYIVSQADRSCPATFTRNRDPLLGALANNGGSTPTRALLAGSPAIDAGAASCPATDQRGVPRPQGAACDIGAFEFAVVNPAPAARLFDGGASNPNPAPPSKPPGEVTGVPAIAPPSRS